MNLIHEQHNLFCFSLSFSHLFFHIYWILMIFFPKERNNVLVKILYAKFLKSSHHPVSHYSDVVSLLFLAFFCFCFLSWIRPVVHCWRICFSRIMSSVEICVTSIICKGKRGKYSYIVNKADIKDAECYFVNVIYGCLFCFLLLMGVLCAWWVFLFFFTSVTTVESRSFIIQKVNYDSFFYLPFLSNKQNKQGH